MTINNLQTIKSLLFFDNPGDVYVVQVMTRAKDFVKPHYSTIIREYYVETVDYLNNKFDEITKLCEVPEHILISTEKILACLDNISLGKDSSAKNSKLF